MQFGLNHVAKECQRGRAGIETKQFKDLACKYYLTLPYTALPFTDSLTSTERSGANTLILNTSPPFSVCLFFIFSGYISCYAHNQLKSKFLNANKSIKVFSPVCIITLCNLDLPCQLLNNLE